MKRALVAFGLALAGCVPTLADVRHEAPAHTLSVVGRYDVLAGCIVDGMQHGPTGRGVVVKLGDLRREIVRRDDRQTITITGLVDSASQQIPYVDLTVRQDGERVAAELRQAFSRITLAQDMWAVVERCAMP